MRDARITQIYEGTNGVQAMDLVGRKLPMETATWRAASSRWFGRNWRPPRGRHNWTR